MSTHLGEMIHLTNTALMEGAKAKLNKDEEGRVESITVEGLMGMPNVIEGSPLSVVESLRRTIGHKAKKIAVHKNSEGHAVYSISPGQARAYGGGEAILSSHIYNRKIPLNEKFIAKFPSNYEATEEKTGYYANIEGKLTEFESKEAFDAHDPSIIKTKLRTYYYDISDPKQKVAYENEIKEMKYQGMKATKSTSIPSSDTQRSYFNHVHALKDKEVLLETQYLFKNQWNSAGIEGTAGLRLYDWQEMNFPNKSIKKGYYLEQTESMKEVRRSLDNDYSY